MVKNSKTYLDWIFGAVILLLPLSGILGGKFHFVFVAASIMAIIVAIRTGFILRDTDKKLPLRPADYLFGAYLLYCLANSFIRGSFIEPLVLAKWLIVAYAWLYSAMSPHFKDVLFKVIVLGGICQAAVILMQATLIIGSTNPVCHLTGTFGSPAPAPMCISLALCMVLDGCIARKKFHLLEASIAIFLLAPLVLTHSRTAWLALSAGLMASLIANLKNRKPAIISAGVALIVICAGLYFIRPASADSRIAVWTVSCEHLADSPLFGKGPASFASMYPVDQGEYFKRHPSSRFAVNADDQVHPFNEIIHLLYEEGIVGLVLMVLLVLLSLKGAGRKELIALCCIIVIGCFSYLSEMLFILSCGAAVLAGGQNRRDNVKGVSVRDIQVAMAFAVCFCIASDIHYRTVSRKLEDASYCLNPGSLAVRNPTFNRTVMDSLEVREKDADVCAVLDRLTAAYPDYDKLCSLGDAYQSIGANEKADSCYTLASRIVPGRMKAYFSLFSLYRDSDAVKAAMYADMVMNKPLKFTGTYALKCREEVCNVLRADQADRSLQLVYPLVEVLALLIGQRTLSIFLQTSEGPFPVNIRAVLLQHHRTSVKVIPLPLAPPVFPAIFRKGLAYTVSVTDISGAAV